MDREEYIDLWVNKSVTVGDVIPMNHGELEKNLKDVYWEFGRALYQATQEKNVEETARLIGKGMIKLESKYIWLYN